MLDGNTQQLLDPQTIPYGSQILFSDDESRWGYSVLHSCDPEVAGERILRALREAAAAIPEEEQFNPRSMTHVSWSDLFATEAQKLLNDSEHSSLAAMGFIALGTDLAVGSLLRVGLALGTLREGPICEPLLFIQAEEEEEMPQETTVGAMIATRAEDEIVETSEEGLPRESVDG